MADGEPVPGKTPRSIREGQAQIDHSTRRSPDLTTNNPWILFVRPTAVALSPDVRSGLRLSHVRNDRDWDGELGISDRLYQEFIGEKNLSWKDGLQQLLNLTQTVHDETTSLSKRGSRDKRQIGRIEHTMISNLTECYMIDYAEKIPRSFINSLIRQGAILSHAEMPDHAYFPIFKDLVGSLYRWKNIYKWLRDLKKSVNVDHFNVADIRRSGDLVVDGLPVDRGYGIKESYYSSPLFLTKDRVFSILDPYFDIQDPYIYRALSPSIFAHIGVSNEPKESASVEYERSVDISDSIRDYGVVRFPPEIQFVFPIDSTGNIRTVLYSHTPIKRAFEKKGMIGEYELFRLFTFMRLHDLTRRAELVDVPSLDEAERILREGQKLGKKGLLKDFDFNTLIVPRIKPEVPEQDSSNGGRRFVDKHKVIWHVRRLPNGYSATEQAAQYAKAHDVTLQANETIVREHYRGIETEEKKSKTPRKAVFHKTLTS